MARLSRGSRYAIHFVIEGRKTQGVGYRTNLAMLALTSGVERLYAENQPKQRGKRTERVAVYAGAQTRRELKKFYERVRLKIPEGARGVKFTRPEPYHSEIVLPTVSEYVSTLTAGELSKGIDVIAALGKEARLGFSRLGVAVGKLDTNLRSQLEELPPKMGNSLVSSLVDAGIIQNSKKKGD